MYDSSWPMSPQMQRDDIEFLGIPLAQICAAKFEQARTRILMKNVVYVGALAALLDLDLDVIKTLLEEQFATKPKLVPLNLQAIMLGYDYAQEHFECPRSFRVKPMTATQNQIMMEGNTRCRTGVSVCGGHGWGLVSHHAVHFIDGRL